eukprot:Lankesteria_metandrocarpae@DN5296_c0_g1_i1.p1
MRKEQVIPVHDHSEQTAALAVSSVCAVVPEDNATHGAPIPSRRSKTATGLRSESALAPASKRARTSDDRSPKKERILPSSLVGSGKVWNPITGNTRSLCVPKPKPRLRRCRVEPASDSDFSEPPPSQGYTHPTHLGLQPLPQCHHLLQDPSFSAR